LFSILLLRISTHQYDLKKGAKSHGADADDRKLKQLLAKDQASTTRDKISFFNIQAPLRVHGGGDVKIVTFQALDFGDALPLAACHQPFIQEGSLYLGISF